MIEARESANFADKTIAKLSFGGYISQKYLHGFNSIRNHIPDAIHPAHTAFAEQPEYFVIGRHLADFKRHASVLLTVIVGHYLARRAHVDPPSTTVRLTRRVLQETRLLHIICQKKPGRDGA